VSNDTSILPLRTLQKLGIDPKQILEKAKENKDIPPPPKELLNSLTSNINMNMTSLKNSKTTTMQVKPEVKPSTSTSTSTVTSAPSTSTPTVKPVEIKTEEKREEEKLLQAISSEEEKRGEEGEGEGEKVEEITLPPVSRGEVFETTTQLLNPIIKRVAQNLNLPEDYVKNVVMEIVDEDEELKEIATKGAAMIKFLKSLPISDEAKNILTIRYVRQLVDNAAQKTVNKIVIGSEGEETSTTGIDKNLLIFYLFDYMMRNNLDARKLLLIKHFARVFNLKEVEEAINGYLEDMLKIMTNTEEGKTNKT